MYIKSLIHLKKKFFKAYLVLNSLKVVGKATQPCMLAPYLETKKEWFSFYTNLL